MRRYARGVTAVVILALALAAVAVGLAAVAVREVLRSLRRFRANVDTARQRLVPLTAELQAELAVTNLEVAAVSHSVERVRTNRARRARRRPTLRRSTLRRH